jgi:peptidoglycan hydrolase-like protein with peptidoglycan-binding domain
MLFATYDAYDARVERIQRSLTTLAKAKGISYFDPKGIDGLWGTNTKNAVNSFRVSVGLDADPANGEYLDAAFETALFNAMENANAGGAAVPAVAVPVQPAGTVPAASTPEDTSTPFYLSPLFLIGAGVFLFGGIALIAPDRSRP